MGEHPLKGRREPPPNQRDEWEEARIVAPSFKSIGRKTNVDKREWEYVDSYRRRVHVGRQFYLEEMFRRKNHGQKNELFDKRYLGYRIRHYSNLTEHEREISQIDHYYNNVTASIERKISCI